MKNTIKMMSMNRLKSRIAECRSIKLEDVRTYSE